MLGCLRKVYAVNVSTRHSFALSNPGEQLFSCLFLSGGEKRNDELPVLGQCLLGLPHAWEPRRLSPRHGTTSIADARLFPDYINCIWETWSAVHQKLRDGTSSSARASAMLDGAPQLEKIAGHWHSSFWQAIDKVASWCPKSAIKLAGSC